MRESVRSAFVEFTSPLEGVVPWMYLDVKGLVTTAIGNLIDPMQVAMPLPWTHFDGSPASRNEIAAEWLRVKGDPSAAKRGHRYTEGITSLRLTDEGVGLVVSRKLSQMDQYLSSRFGDAYEDWPANAQLATLSMSWACGPAFRFPALDQALRNRDFAAAATHCTISEAGNPGIVPRNVRNRLLYLNADRVQGFRLDPASLNWTSLIGVSDAETLPDLSTLCDDDETPREPIIHIQPHWYRTGKPPPDDAA